MQNKSCDGAVTEDECAKALSKMVNNKSSGSAGLTTKFFLITMA